MDITSVLNQGRGVQPLDGDKGASLREADFMAIILSEITNQDPMEPTETSAMVENMQKLQELSNANFEKFRNDIRWAQDLVGQSVTANQSFLTAEQEQGLKNRGVDPSTGFGIVEGKVKGFKVVGETVWVSIDDKDFAIDNIQQIKPPAVDQIGNASFADSLLGKKVTYFDSSFSPVTGTVERVNWNGDDISLTVSGKVVPFNSISGLSL